jgi:hypothetical protein
MVLSLWFLDYVSVELFRYFPRLPSILFTIVLMWFPTLGYLDQLRKMIRSQSGEYFNRSTALILLFSNSLRFLYWLHEPWKPFLLLQAVAVVATQLVLATVFFHYERARREKVGSARWLWCSRGLRQALNARSAHSAPDFFTSLAACGFLILTVFLTLSALFGYRRVDTLFAFVANLADTAVSIPQFTQVVIERNVANTSVVLILQFVAGDITKFIMFRIAGTTWPFFFGAALQICIDSIVAASYFWQSAQKPRKETQDDPRSTL